MDAFDHYMQAYQDQMAKGAVRKAYRGLIEYIMELRAFFSKKYPDFFISGSIYQGYMDMTYFAIASPSLKVHDLKVAIVFIHESCRFEIWLSAANKRVQRKYWDMFKEAYWKNFRIIKPDAGVDGFLVYNLDFDPDFSDLDALTAHIEIETLKFIAVVEKNLSEIQNSKS